MSSKAKTGSMFDELIEVVGAELVEGAKKYVHRAIEKILEPPRPPKRKALKAAPVVETREIEKNVFTTEGAKDADHESPPG